MNGQDCSNDDAHWMGVALQQAQLAAERGEVPVGAVVVRDNQLVAASHNAPIALQDPTAHAEIRALRAAGQALNNYRLNDCTLYVTAEPCAMCAGASWHARVGRVVYGAAEPRTGALASVAQLFNHSLKAGAPEVVAGVRAQEAAALLQHFFAQRRRPAPWPLRDDALRSPEFDLPGWPGEGVKSCHVADLPALGGLRLHYLDAGPRDAATTWVLLHGNPTYSYVWRHWIKPLVASGSRVLAPDLIGFGLSDKPKHPTWHSWAAHHAVLQQWLAHVGVERVRLVVQDWGGLLGLTLPAKAAWTCEGLVVLNTMLPQPNQPLPEGFVQWRTFCERQPGFDVAALLRRACPHLTQAECGAYAAPFAHTGLRAALRAFPAMVPDGPEHAGAPWVQEARLWWATNPSLPVRMVVGGADPVCGTEVMQALHRACWPQASVQHWPDAGHFVQEWVHPALGDPSALVQQALGPLMSHSAP